MGLYPTIELVIDQEKQVRSYYKQFDPNEFAQLDSLYGAELARRVEEAEKGNKFKELWLSLKQKHVILTNPDIFHLVAHFRYQNPTYNRTELPLTLARNPDLYVADEFHIFGVHQEAAILNPLCSDWGALQAQGMLIRMSRGNAEVMQQVQERMTEDLRRVSGEQLDKKRGHWFALGKDAFQSRFQDSFSRPDVRGISVPQSCRLPASLPYIYTIGKAIQEELLRFRGGSDLQAAIWDGSRFYIYDLLRLLPYAEVEVIDRETFLEAAKQSNHAATEFPEKYIQVYLKLQRWSEQRFPIALFVR